MSARRGDWLQTYTGVAFYPLDPLPEDISIRDIAHQLSMVCRYGGAVQRFYSVAEHCCILSDYVRQHRPDEPMLALQALLHDASEAYIGDVPRPLKWMPEMVGYREMEDRIERAVQKAFGLPAPGKGTDPLIPDIDTRIMIDEASVLLQRITNHWSSHLGEPLGVVSQIIGMGPQAAEARFLATYHALTVAIDGGLVR